MQNITLFLMLLIVIAMQIVTIDLVAMLQTGATSKKTNMFPNIVVMENNDNNNNHNNNDNDGKRKLTMTTPPSSSSSSSSLRKGSQDGSSSSSSSSSSCRDEDGIYEMASRHSGGFFTDVPEWDWKRHMDRIAKRQNHFDPNNPFQHSSKPAQYYQFHYEPDFTCPHERRVGGMGDGPKWVCDPHRIAMKQQQHKQKQKQRRDNGEGNIRKKNKNEKNRDGTDDDDDDDDDKKDGCLVYSIGSRDKFEFEEGVRDEISPDCEIHTFDLRDFSDSAPKGIAFHPWGLSDLRTVNNRTANTAATPYKTLAQTVRELDHVGRTIDVFKIDCEGCEWDTFEDWFDPQADVTLRQILVEVHLAPSHAHRFFDFLQSKGYVTFHKEPNTFGCRGACQEYAFLKLESEFFSEARALASSSSSSSSSS